MSAVARWLDGVASWMLLGILRGYQVFLSPFVGQQCRYQPTCSRYFMAAVRKYGALRGSLKGLGRVCRCHPWHEGGYDPP